MRHCGPPEALLGVSCALLLISLCLVPVALAQEPDPTPSEPGPAAAPKAPVKSGPKLVRSTRIAKRELVLVQVEGEQAASLRPLLLSLLSARMSERWTLSEHAQKQTLQSWITRVRELPNAALGVVVDVSQEGRWTLYIVDVERDLAITREVRATSKADPAALEAIVNIVSSSLQALEMGAGVGVEATDVALSPALEAPATAPPVKQHAPPTKPSPPKKPLPLPSGPSSRALNWDASAGVSVRSIDDSYLSWGSEIATQLAFAGTSHEWVARLGIGWHAPVAIESSFGEFSLQHTFTSLRVGPQWKWRASKLTIQGGPSLARSARSDGRSTAQHRVTVDTARWQPGIEGAGIWRIDVTPSWAASASLGLGYWLLRTRYATSEGDILLEPSKLYLFGRVALHWSTEQQ